ncbi:MAG: GreA/GreB family elongation factor [Proteobacteria bacterium]|nr:GreA/GreB family elongation factor [Pseudomonadota bacterium]MDE3208896.1 GreA/GreB family elongation factor [Pseudomonadota bacterium]
MSRAFVKEDSASALMEEVVERPISTYPNYMTRQGFEQLKQHVDDLLRTRSRKGIQDTGMAGIERDLRYYQARLQSALVVDGKDPQTGRVHFGAKVTFVDSSGEEHVFRLVGEDEADVAKGRISWVSPLARQLLGKQIGGQVVWLRDDKPLSGEITAIVYPESGD